MGALPKKRPSKTRSNQAHSAWSARQQAVAIPSVITCPQCVSLQVPHRVCSECGYYKGEQILQPQTQVRRVTS